MAQNSSKIMVVESYIQNQYQHHKKDSYKDELCKFFKEYKIDLMSNTCGIDINIVHVCVTLSGFILSIKLTQDFVSLRPELLHNGAMPLR